jgi:hypothetical protein
MAFGLFARKPDLFRSLFDPARVSHSTVHPCVSISGHAARKATEILQCAKHISPPKTHCTPSACVCGHKNCGVIVTAQTHTKRKETFSASLSSHANPDEL